MRFGIPRRRRTQPGHFRLALCLQRPCLRTSEPIQPMKHPMRVKTVMISGFAAVKCKYNLDCFGGHCRLPLFPHAFMLGPRLGASGHLTTSSEKGSKRVKTQTRWPNRSLRSRGAGHLGLLQGLERPTLTLRLHCRARPLARVLRVATSDAQKLWHAALVLQTFPACCAMARAPGGPAARMSLRSASHRIVPPPTSAGSSEPLRSGLIALQRSREC